MKKSEDSEYEDEQDQRPGVFLIDPSYKYILMIGEALFNYHGFTGSIVKSKTDGSGAMRVAVMIKQTDHNQFLESEKAKISGCLSRGAIRDMFNPDFPDASVSLVDVVSADVLLGWERQTDTLASLIHTTVDMQRMMISPITTRC